MFRKIIVLVSLTLLPIVAYAETPTKNDLVDSKNSNEHKDLTLAPNYKSNSHADKSTFITKEQAIEKARITENGGILWSVELMTWDQFSQEAWNKPNSMADRANDRMVWVVNIDYPKGIDTKGGYFFNAKQTIVFDAETGQVFGGITSGDANDRRF